MSFILNPYRHAAAGAFSPTDISGLHVWYDGSDITTMFDTRVGGSQITGNGDTVNRLEDKSGNDYHAYVATGGIFLNKAPTYIASGINSIGSLDFMTGGAKALVPLESDLITQPNVSGAFTVFYIFQRDADGDVSCSFGSTNYPWLWFSNNIIYWAKWNGSAENTGIAYNDGDEVTLPGDFCTTITRDASNDCSLYLDGGSAIDTATNKTGDLLMGLLGNSNATTTSQPVWGELLIYNSELSSTDINSVHDYLANKWGITIATV